MNKSVLRNFIKLAIYEAKIARVPQQLVHDEETETDENEEINKVDEFSSAGAIVGYTAPIGMLGGQRRPKK